MRFAGLIYRSLIPRAVPGAGDGGLSGPVHVPSEEVTSCSEFSNFPPIGCPSLVRFPASYILPISSQCDRNRSNDFVVVFGCFIRLEPLYPQ